MGPDQGEALQDRPASRDPRKEQNWKKRQRKKQSREAAKRAKMVALTEAQQQNPLDCWDPDDGRAGGPGAQDAPKINSKTTGTVRPRDETNKLIKLNGINPPAIRPSAEGAQSTEKFDINNNNNNNQYDDDDNDDKYDYGVVTGKTKGNIFVHGNYDRYYGYRVPGKLQSDGTGGEGSSENADPRLRLFEKRWFHKKRCLDVGCNEGVLTLNLVKEFKTATMMAIDLDEYLVKRACVNLRKARSAAATEHAKSRAHNEQQPDPPQQLQQADQELQKQQQYHGRRRKQAKQTMVSLSKTWFVHGNILASKVERSSFDCVTALSVSKWIHLHSGDGGIRAFFSKVWDMLAPGGKFILEPQSWRSYKSAIAKIKRADTNQVPETSYFRRIDQLKLRPETFCDLLTLEYGFHLVKRLDSPTDAPHGFEDRSLLVFVKRH